MKTPRNQKTKSVSCLICAWYLAAQVPDYGWAVQCRPWNQSWLRTYIQTIAPVLSACVLELPVCVVSSPPPPSLWELLAPDFGDYTLLSRSINTSEVGSVM